jgi:hypothetical protein
LGFVAVQPAVAQQRVAAPPVVIDGPDAAIQGMSQMSIARDGTGAVVYLKADHVFVSRLVAGVFQPPEQVDAGLPGPSSQPVIAAANGGGLLIAFINTASLFVVSRASAAAGYTAPSNLAAGASNPSLQLTPLGKGYLAFTGTGQGGHDVRVAYWAGGQWTLIGAPLDAVPTDDAGVGTGRPQVAAAGDGVAIVVWGENGHVYSRRVWGTSPSVVFEQADPPSVQGWAEVAADLPAVSVGGDSSYAPVIFREIVASGPSSQSRVLVRRLRGSQYEGVIGADALTPGGEGALEPHLQVTEYGAGFSTTARDHSNQVIALRYGNNSALAAVLQVDSLPNASNPYPVPGTAGLYSTLIAWQHDPGLIGQNEIRMRYALDGSNLGPEQVLSDPALGATNAALGLQAGGNIDGDAIVTWVQGIGSSRRIVSDQLYKEPGGFSPLSSFQYAQTAQPLLTWNPPRELWGPLIYTVSLDGVLLGQTAAASFSPPAALSQGAHTWQVSASNRAGLTSSSGTGTVFVDTLAPTAKLTVTGRQQVDSQLHVNVSWSDVPPGLAPSVASGVASVLLNGGDHTVVEMIHNQLHRYKRAGRYLIVVYVTDRAGNRTTLTQWVKIKAKKKPKPPGKAKPKPPVKKHHQRAAR